MIFTVLIFSSDYTYYFSDVHIFFFKLFINFLHIVKQMTEAAIPSDVYFPYIRSFKYFNDNILWMRNKCCKIRRCRDENIYADCCLREHLWGLYQDGRPWLYIMIYVLIATPPQKGLYGPRDICVERLARSVYPRPHITTIFIWSSVFVL